MQWNSNPMVVLILLKRLRGMKNRSKPAVGLAASNPSESAKFFPNRIGSWVSRICWPELQYVPSDRQDLSSVRRHACGGLLRAPGSDSCLWAVYGWCLSVIGWPVAISGHFGVFISHGHELWGFWGLVAVVPRMSLQHILCVCGCRVTQRCILCSDIDQIFHDRCPESAESLPLSLELLWWNYRLCPLSCSGAQSVIFGSVDWWCRSTRCLNDGCAYSRNIFD